MVETIQQTNVSAKTQQNMEAYFKTHDLRYVTDDAVFINMATGEETKGKEAIGQMLNYLYHIAFDAQAKIRHTIITEKNAVLEADFTGKHIGDFANMKPTNKMVTVPICITYDLENGLVKKARIYMLADVLMRQLS